METARVIPVSVLSQSGTIRVALDFQAILGREAFYSVKLIDFDLSRFVHQPQDEGGILVLVHNEPRALSEAVKELRRSMLDSVFVFVNLFDYPFPCLSLLTEGFADFIAYPFRCDEVNSCLRYVWSRRRMFRSSELESTKVDLSLAIALRDLIGLSPIHQNILNQIRVLARTDAPVLIAGETGVGKDMCARAIHYSSARLNMPFIPVNCGGIPDDLFENEFFGHERGAYTDAREKYQGFVQGAEGGTLFLDEVESLSSVNQTKLLRFIEGGSYIPLGCGKVQRANVRIIAATNADMSSQLWNGTFRKDLYYRISVLNLKVPSLRDRAEDIPALAIYFLSRFCKLYATPDLKLTASAIEELKAYSWPGNVRELENAIHCAVVQATVPEISHIELRTGNFNEGPGVRVNHESMSFNQIKSQVINTFERRYVQQLLNECGGNVSEAARRAGKNRRSFWEVMRRHNISRFVH